MLKYIVCIQTKMLCKRFYTRLLTSEINTDIQELKYKLLLAENIESKEYVVDREIGSTSVYFENKNKNVVSKKNPTFSFDCNVTIIRWFRCRPRDSSPLSLRDVCDRGKREREREKR